MSEETRIDIEGQPQVPPRTNGLAVASLVTGILGLLCLFPLVSPLAAIVTGHVALGQNRRSQGRLHGNGLALAGVVMGYLGLLLVPLLIILAGLLLPALAKAREQARRTMDSNNLKQLSLGCMMYATEYRGELPQDLAQLAELDYLPASRVFVCPNGNTPPPASAADIRNGQCDYVYLGAGLNDQAANPATTVIAYTKPEMFHGKWQNLAFLDGHTESVAAPDLASALRQHPDWKVPAAAVPPPAPPQPKR